MIHSPRWSNLLSVFVCLGVIACAQRIDVAVPIAGPLQTEAVRLTQETSAPGNASPEAIRAHFEFQLQMAESKSDFATALALCKAWNAALPKDKTPKQKVLLMLVDEKTYDSAISFNLPHFDAPDNRYSGRLKNALNVYFSGRDEEVWARAETILQDAQKERVVRYSGSSSGWSPFRQSSATLGIAGAFELQARVLLRKTDYWQALAAAEKGIDAARQSLDLVNDMPPGELASAAAFQSRETLASLLIQKIRAQMAKGTTISAVQTLDEYLPVAREVESHPRYFWNIAFARYGQKNFHQAEVYFRKADDAAKLSGYPALSLFRAECLQGVIGALEGQHQWKEAIRELGRADAVAGDDETLKYRIRYRFERSYAYLMEGVRIEESLDLLRELADRSTDGLLTAHATGLRGVALWRLQRESALAVSLLKNAVEVYMKPVYFDGQSQGLSADVRDLVIETYMEAVFDTSGEDAMTALAPAEWLRSSMVQSALTDAATRAAARDSELSEMVRRDQDLKNEIRNMQSKLTLADDSAASAQVNNLYIQRSAIQARIKQKFPGFDQLVAPTPPDKDAAAAALANDEVLVQLLPTEQSVFVWALTADGRNASVKANLPRADLIRLVTDLRKSLDFGEMDGNAGEFNKHVAFEIYERLLAPVQSSIIGKKHMIVAAGGVLGQVPFGVLITGETKSATTAPPYLIKQLAISHVPSLSAWLAAKKYATTQRAPETLIAWGDPMFAVLGSEPLEFHSNVRRLALTRSDAHVNANSRAERGGFRYSDIPPLPETRDELIAIADALGANPLVDLHLGAKATRASVLKSSAEGELARKKVVVFATHGLMAGDLPTLTQPALALAIGVDDAQDPVNGLLTLEDVLGMKLNADWVVLSACNTAAADGKIEEAMSGLARGFFYAGSRSLLVTHWAVETESAKLLTTNTFHNYVADPSARKAESLRRAMLSVMEIPAYAHPAYWGPYALVGDGGR
jgi:CHAT domain-containing protein/tetratricopeptide (TPR) repeat protein